MESKGSDTISLPQNLQHEQQLDALMTNLSLKVQYLPCSPDLTTPDFDLWWYLMEEVYHMKPATLEELQEEITSVTCSHSRTQIGWC
jgi:hypothetical protein